MLNEDALVDYWWLALACSSQEQVGNLLTIGAKPWILRAGFHRTSTRKAANSSSLMRLRQIPLDSSHF